jgi:hypothetical protein
MTVRSACSRSQSSDQGGGGSSGGGVGGRLFDFGIWMGLVVVEDEDDEEQQRRQREEEEVRASSKSREARLLFGGLESRLERLEEARLLLKTLDWEDREAIELRRDEDDDDEVSEGGAAYRESNV